MNCAGHGLYARATTAKTAATSPPIAALLLSAAPVKVATAGVVLEARDVAADGWVEEACEDDGIPLVIMVAMVTIVVMDELGATAG